MSVQETVSGIALVSATDSGIQVSEGGPVKDKSSNCQRFGEEISDSMDLHVRPGYFC